MKKLIKLNYHSVFKYENDKESFKYNGAAFLEELDDKTIISYEDKTKIKFILKKDEVFYIMMQVFCTYIKIELY
ncbi:hypothetical protein SD457_20115 [Coprobacillaceae bacterium CR2/5/TPMF4]|nr:hypothetical protein SD457_20115 [Coprobacillaceae bacterium CR2/5/TPMF4]